MMDPEPREQHLTAELVRERLRMDERILALDALGIPVEIGYEDDSIWLSIAGDQASLVVWPGWWEAVLATREDRAIEVAARLLKGWGR